jgi:hypothetical protein
MTLWTLGSMAAQLSVIDQDIELAGRQVIEKACQMVEREAKESLGHYHLGWPRLKPETIARKATGDSPLLETGEMRDSIEHVVMKEGDEVVGYVGSNNMKAVWQELGTSRGIPPRSFLMGAAMRREHKIHEMAERRIAAAAAGRGPAATEIRELFRVAREFGRHMKELWNSLAEPPEQERDDDQ